MNPPNGLDEIIEQFGDIHQFIGEDGNLSPEWQNTHLAHCILPFSLPLDWNRSLFVNVMLCHKKLVDVFENVFQEIADKGLQSAIKTYGGCFAYRPQRGSEKLSTHAWGIAVDLNPFENKLGTTGNMDAGVIDVFKRAGFVWGGDFHSRRDSMHFQYCSGY